MPTSAKKRKISFVPLLVTSKVDRNFIAKDVRKTHNSFHEMKIGSNIFLITSSIIAEDYLWIYAEVGDIENHAQEVYNQDLKKKDANPRDKNLPEINKQLFGIFDFSNHKILINDQHKIGFFIKYIKEITEIDFEYYKEIGDIEQVTTKIKTLKTVKLKVVNDMFTHDVYHPDVQSIIEDSSSFDINLKYDRELSNVLKDKLKQIFDKKHLFKNIIISGIDEDNDSNIFNLDSIIIKKDIYCEFINNKFDEKEVQSKIIEAIKNVPN